MQARVMGSVHDTSSQCALQMYEVSSKDLYLYNQVKEQTQFGVEIALQQIKGK